MKNKTLNYVLSLLAIILFCAGCGTENMPAEPGSLTFQSSLSPLDPCVVKGGSVTFSLETEFDLELTYVWTFTGGDIANSTEASPTVTYDTKGRFTASVIIRDTDDSQSSNSTSVFVKDSCEDLVATIESPADGLSVPVGQSVAFNGLASGGDGPYTYAWETYVSGGQTLFSSTDQNTSFSFPEVGQWVVSLTVTDAVGDTGHSSAVVNVTSASAFGVNIETSGDPGAIPTGQTTVFSGVATGAQGAVEYVWDFGASGVASYSGQNANVIFPNAGIFSVTLTATDLSNLVVATAILEITVVLAQQSFQSPVTNVKKIAPGFQTADKGATDGLGFMGSNGMAVFDPATRTFGDVHLGVMTFGGVAATPAGVEPAFIFWDYYGLFIASYNSGSGTYDAPSEFPGGIRVSDVCMYGDDPAASGFLVATWSDVIRFTWNAGTSAFEESATYEEALFQGASLNSIVARDENAFLGIGSGTPNQLLYHDGVEGADATVIGDLSDGSNDLTCLGDICVVKNRQDDSCSIITWVGNTVNIVGSFPTGDNPQSVDLTLLENGNVGCVVPNRYDNTVTVVEINPAGGVVSNNTFAIAVPATPTEAVWAHDGTTDVLVYNTGDGTVFVVSTGL